MKILLSEIAAQVEGQLHGKDKAISVVSIDTRTLTKGDLYIAIKGQNFNGHSFIKQAEIAGASAVLVETLNDTDLPQIIVNDSHLALAQLAAIWKDKVKVIAIAVTGSNGKTTVKEMIASVLAVNAETLSTRGNLNNDIGVPLTLLKLDHNHQYAVIEMGANHAGEIAYSSKFAKADVAMINNVSAAHIEGFGSVEGVAKAKGEIIQGLQKEGVAILNKDDHFYDLWEAMAEDRKIISFGLDQTADVTAKQIQTEIKNNQFVSQFKLQRAQEELDIRLNLAGQHNVVNALAAAACCIATGIGLPQIKQGLEKVQPVTGRLQPLVGNKGNLIIDDTYNANPGSLKAALQVLKQSKGKPWVVLGAFAEMGVESLEIHEQIGRLIKSMNVVRLLTIGSDAKITSEAFGKGATFFSSQEQLIAALSDELIGNETLLIKGSRAQSMENVVAALVSDFRK